MNATMLYGTIYFSVESTRFTESDLLKLEISAAEANSRYGISGYLFYDRGSFIQYLEGSKVAVTNLMNNIKKDDRHIIKQIREQHYLTARRFPSWSMRLVVPEAIISIERLLIDHLAWINSLRTHVELDDKIVWSMVDRLSQYQMRLNSVG